MAPPNDPANLINSAFTPMRNDIVFDLVGGKLSVKGLPLLSEISSNVTFKSFSAVVQSSAAPPPLLDRAYARSNNGGFLGFSQREASDRLTYSIGKFGGRDFLSIFRFKTWWSTQWVGNSGSDLQMETQWVMLNVPELNSYVVVLPIIEGNFRSALCPGPDHHMLICAESGSSTVKTSSFSSIAYIHISDDPYTLIKEACTAVRVHLNTFKLMEEKSPPPLVNKFGWCTWDAFYLTVDPAGISHGLREFADGGLSPRFLIIDDGWQSINFDGQDLNEDAENLILGGDQITARLHSFKECRKFRNYQSGSMTILPSFDPNKPKMLINKAHQLEMTEKARVNSARAGLNQTQFELQIEKLKREIIDMIGEGDNSSNGCSNNSGLKAFTKDLKTNFKGLDDIYVWHALAGAWGGVRPNATHLNSNIVPCKFSPGLDRTMTDLAVVKIVEGSIGVVDPDQADQLYDSMHSYLAQAGVTGVKMDVIHTLECVSEDYGGRVDLAKAYYNGLSKSLIKNFNGTGCISSMQQCNDFFLLGTQQISMGRVGDDFWSQDPNGDPMGVYWLQGVHMIHCAYNSLWMGQFVHPDWDMFQSDHYSARFHGGSRAICGGPVYVSDSLGSHDFDLLKKLVYPDGTIPQCVRYALPTRDCLFKNPLSDGKSLLKIWNFNKFGGVIGAFNCQGAGWDPNEHRIKGYPQCYKPISGSVHPADLEWGQNPEPFSLGETEEYAIYLSEAEKLILSSPQSDPISVALQPSTFEIFTFVPIRSLSRSAKFAPIGLTNMFNSGGTIEGVVYEEFLAKIDVKGEGFFLAYSSIKPDRSGLNGAEVEFRWSGEGKMEVNIPWNEERGGISELTIVYS